MSTRKYSW